MTAQAEQAVTAFLQLFDVDAPDLADIAARLSPDARYLNHARHAEPHRGREAIQTELLRQFGLYRDCECRIDAIASNDAQVFTERHDTVTMRKDGRKVAILVCAVFDVDPSGLITYWREYWDRGDVMSQIG